MEWVGLDRTDMARQLIHGWAAPAPELGKNSQAPSSSPSGSRAHWAEFDYLLNLARGKGKVGRGSRVEEGGGRSRSRRRGLAGWAWVRLRLACACIAVY